MSIRLATAIDFPSIENIYNTSKLDELKFEEEDFTLLSLSDDEKRRNHLLNSTIYVYEKNNNIVGFIAYLENIIGFLFVSPQQRGLNIGQELLQFVLRKIKNNTFLNVVCSNVPAINLYKKFGFKIREEIKGEYHGFPVEIYRMEKKQF